MSVKLRKSNSLLLCIDYQEKLLPKIHMVNEITDKAAMMIRAAQIFKIPIIVTEQYPKGLGRTVKDIVVALGRYYEPIEKTTFNCFDSPMFLKRLKSFKQKELIVMGIESHVCVYQTVLEAIRRKYHVHILEDAISSRNSEDRMTAFKRMVAEGAYHSCVEMAIFEILQISGTDEFKRILEFVK